VVFGRAASLRIADIAKPGDKLPELKAGAGLEGIASLDKLRFASGQRSTADIRMEMQQVR
jgi:succinate dehydrogenase/fumarate reductase flavoprotein subunit